MVSEEHRHRRLLAGCTLAVTASLALMAFALVYRVAEVSELVVYPLILTLASVMGVGASLAVFNLRRN